MSETIEHHEYFGELSRDTDLGGWSGEVRFPPTGDEVRIFIPGSREDLDVSPESVQFYEELISVYPEISAAIQERFYELHEEFDDMSSKDDVWSIFQLECIALDDVNLTDSKSWRLIYGTDYGGHIYEFEMNGKAIVSMSLEG